MTPSRGRVACKTMGDKSPKATQKQASQKQSKSSAAKKDKDKATAAKQVPKTSKK